jgi:hypothetical protein
MAIDEEAVKYGHRDELALTAVTKGAKPCCHVWQGVRVKAGELDHVPGLDWLEWLPRTDHEAPRRNESPIGDRLRLQAATEQTLLRPKQTSMIVGYIRCKIDPTRTGEFDHAYRRAGALLDASPHCQRWEAARCVDEPDKQVVRIERDSVEGRLRGFRQSGDFTPFLEATQPFYKNIEGMTHYEITSQGRAQSEPPGGPPAASAPAR